MIPLLVGGKGINVYKAIYRDGAPVATSAERRRALIGWAGGSFLVKDLAAAAVTSLPDNVVTQLEVANKTVIGPHGNSKTRPRRRSRSPTTPGCWSSATRTGPTAACRSSSAPPGWRWPPCSAR